MRFNVVVGEGRPSTPSRSTRRKAVDGRAKPDHDGIPAGALTAPSLGHNENATALPLIGQSLRRLEDDRFQHMRFSVVVGEGRPSTPSRSTRGKAVDGRAKPDHDGIPAGALTAPSLGHNENATALPLIGQSLRRLEDDRLRHMRCSVVVGEGRPSTPSRSTRRKAVDGRAKPDHDGIPAGALTAPSLGHNENATALPLIGQSLRRLEDDRLRHMRCSVVVGEGRPSTPSRSTRRKAVDGRAKPDHDGIPAGAPTAPSLIHNENATALPLIGQSLRRLEDDRFQHMRFSVVVGEGRPSTPSRSTRGKAVDGRAKPDHDGIPAGALTAPSPGHNENATALPLIGQSLRRLEDDRLRHMRCSVVVGEGRPSTPSRSTRGKAVDGRAKPDHDGIPAGALTAPSLGHNENATALPLIGQSLRRLEDDRFQHMRFSVVVGEGRPSTPSRSTREKAVDGRAKPDHDGIPAGAPTGPVPAITRMQRPCR